MEWGWGGVGVGEKASAYRISGQGLQMAWPWAGGGAGGGPRGVPERHAQPLLVRPWERGKAASCAEPTSARNGTANDKLDNLPTIPRSWLPPRLPSSSFANRTPSIPPCFLGTRVGPVRMLLHPLRAQSGRHHRQVPPVSFLTGHGATLCPMGGGSAAGQYDRDRQLPYEDTPWKGILQVLCLKCPPPKKKPGPVSWWPLRVHHCCTLPRVGRTGVRISRAG